MLGGECGHDRGAQALAVVEQPVGRDTGLLDQVRPRRPDIAGEAFLARVAARNGVQPDLLRRSPAVLVGTVPHLADTLIERRERYGFSHLQLDAGFPPDDLTALFPLVARLSGS